MPVTNYIFMLIFIVGSIIVTIYFVYSLIFKDGKIKDKLKKWIEIICDLFWGIG